MKKLFLIPMAFVLFSVSACAGETGETIAQQITYTIGNALSVAEQAGKQYASGDFGTPKADVLTNIEKYDNVAKTAMDKAITDAKAGNSLTGAEQVAATQAVELFVNYLKSQGVTVATSSN